MAVVAAMVVITGALPASADDFPKAQFENRGSGNGCLDLGGYLNGSPARLARCDRYAKSQQWTLLDSGLFLNEGAGNGCLDLTSYQNGGQAVLSRCDERVASQLWDLEQFPDSSTGTLRNRGSGNGCLQFAAYADRTPATLTRCALNDPHQAWTPVIWWPATSVRVRRALHRSPGDGRGW